MALAIDRVRLLQGNESSDCAANATDDWVLQTGKQNNVDSHSIGANQSTHYPKEMQKGGNTVQNLSQAKSVRIWSFHINILLAPK